MSRRLIVRPEAEAEMAEAFDWYEQRLPGLGSEFLLCVDAVLHAILRDPHRWPQVHRIVRRALTRRFPYEVFFVEDEERVVVLSVFHAKRNPRSWQERT
jgi:plasmid stabilization system protein ParE